MGSTLIAFSLLFPIYFILNKLVYVYREKIAAKLSQYKMARVIENVKMPTIIMTHNKTLAAQLITKVFRVFWDLPLNSFESVLAAN